MVMDIVMRNTIEVAWTVVPQNVDDGEVLEMSSSNIKEGFGKCEGWMDDDVDGDNGKGGIDLSPLKVVFRANLNRRRRSEAERNNGTIDWSMTKLSFCPICLEGP